MINNELKGMLQWQLHVLQYGTDKVSMLSVTSL